MGTHSYQYLHLKYRLKTEWKDIDENILCPLMPSSTTLDYANVIEDSNDDPPKNSIF